jgi:ERF superfamily
MENDMSEMGAKLAMAFVKAQAEFDGAKKDSANPFFKSKYADLSSVAQAISTALASHKLGYIQVSHERENSAAIETIIVHESGETYSCGIVACPVSKADAQGYGSAITYCRRYSLSAAFGVCPEDDDGNAAAKAKPKSATINPNDVGKDFWNSAEGEEKECLESYLRSAIDYLSADDAQGAAAFFYTKIHDMEEQAAVWSKLDSKQRAAIRKFKPEQVAAMEASK